MIRDENNIYGERNDPNTVLASGTLTQDSLIVGDGNKGVKSYTSTGKQLIYLRNGTITELPFAVANKVLGTDESGNLVWKDL